MSVITATRYRERTTEAQMRDAIGTLVTLHGGAMFFVNDSRRTPEMEHWLDLELILPHLQTVAHVELKSQRRNLTDGQRHILALLRECHRSESFVVRPVPREDEIAFDDFCNWLGGGS